MSDLVRKTSSELMKPDSEMSESVGSAMMKASAVTGGLVVASMLPFISLPFLIVALFLAGGYLKFK